MADSISVTMLDNSNETTSFGVTVAPVIGANLGAVKTAVETLETNLGNLGLLAIKSDSINIKTRFNVTKPTDDAANREMGVRYHMQDDNGNKTTVTQGGADLQLFPFAANGVDILVIPFAGGNAAIDAMIQWLEANAVHPISGDSLTVFQLEKVGRNI